MKTSNINRKQMAAKQHNADYEAGKLPVYPRLVKSAEYSPARALKAEQLENKTSGTGTASKGGKRMRARANTRFESIMRGRDKISALLQRAGTHL